jgi:hypothetical protein
MMESIVSSLRGGAAQKENQNFKKTVEPLTGARRGVAKCWPLPGYPKLLTATG